MKQLTALTVLAIAAMNVLAQEPHIFIPNLGQLLTTDSTPVSRAYYAHVPGGTVYFDEDTVSFVHAVIDTSAATDDTLYRFDMRYLSTSQYASDFMASDESDFYYNFYYPHCDTGITGVHALGQLDVAGMWHGVDLSYIGLEGGYLTRFVVAPEWTWPPIQWTFDGLDTAYIGAFGELQLQTPLGSFLMPPPIAYSGTDTFIASYTRTGSTFGLQQQGWLGLQPLVFEWGWNNLPPTGCEQGLEWSTYFGTFVDWESGNDVAVNETGAFMCGETSFDGIPNVPGSPIAFNYSGWDDVILAKFDNGDSLRWFTYFGGEDHDEAWSVALGAGAVFITGRTYSDSLVLEFDPGDYQNPAPGHGFMAYFDHRDNLPGGTLQYSTYFGGTGDELYNKVVTGYGELSHVEVYIGGHTESSYFPLKDMGNGAHFQDSTETGFIAKFYCDPVLGTDTLIMSTKFGSPGKITTVIDMAWAPSHTGYQRFYAVGETQEGSEFPILIPQDAFDNGGAYGGGKFDGFIAQFDGDGATQLLWCTYFGGDDNFSDAPHERCMGVLTLFPASAPIYVVGFTDADEGSFPLMRDDSSSGTPYYDSIFAHHPEYYAHGATQWDVDGFIAEFTATGQQLWTTYYGESRVDFIRAIARDDIAGTIYIAGNQADKYQGTGQNIPTLTFPGTYNQQYAGNAPSKWDGHEHEVFLAEFDVNNNHEWATFFGGYEADFVSNYDLIADWYNPNLPTMTGHGLATQRDESLYLVGTTFTAQYEDGLSFDDFPLCDPGDPAYFLEYTYFPANRSEYPYISRFAIDALTVGLNEVPRPDLSAWPNPTTSDVWFDPDLHGEVNVTVFSLGGESLLTCTLTGSEPVNLAGLPSGMYILQVVNSANVQRFTVIKVSK